MHEFIINSCICGFIIKESHLFYLTFHRQFNHKKYQDKNSKSNQNFIISFIEFLMHQNVFPIGENHNNNKSDKEKQSKNELSGRKHGDNIFAKFKQL